MGAEVDGVFGKETLLYASKHYNLSPKRAAHFFGQCWHETNGFTQYVENLRYSEKGLLKTFKKYFTKSQAHKYAGDQEDIANRVYANRMGNKHPGDGWKFRGRGPIHLTGLDNYQALADYLGRPEIMTNPDLVATELAFESAFFYFNKHNLWPICDMGVNNIIVRALTKKINGGTLGLAERLAVTKRFYALMET